MTCPDPLDEVLGSADQGNRDTAGIAGRALPLAGVDRNVVSHPVSTTFKEEKESQFGSLLITFRLRL
jgi:hypothetical protein